jgi:oligopeptide/dipeptide ABC transporter ATP-binding protein
MVVPILNVDELSIRYADRSRALEAVAGASLRIAPQECVGVVGESGSGKSQLFLAAMGLLAGHARVTGSIRFAGDELLGAKAAALNRVRGSKLSMIFQDPMTSLTPHLRIGTQLAEVLVCHLGVSWTEARSAAGRMLERVQLTDPKRRLNQYPHELSGGMRQRVMLAMSLLCRPDLLIADEPTTALDVTVQAEILALLRSLQAETDLSVILVTHDWGVVADICDRAVVMYAGQVVEQSPVGSLFHDPHHPYTLGLQECNPERWADTAELPVIPGTVPPPGRWPRACRFHQRCRFATTECTHEPIPLVATAQQGNESRQVRCLHWREVQPVRSQ